MCELVLFFCLQQGELSCSCWRRHIAAQSKKQVLDAQGVMYVLRAVTPPGDVLSVLTDRAIGRLYSGCSHLRCLRWDDSGPHFIFGFVVTVERYVSWLKLLLLVRSRSNMMWPERVSDHGFVYSYCEADSLEVGLEPLCAVCRHGVTYECIWMASVDLHLCEGPLKRSKNLIKVARAAVPFCDSLYNRTLSHDGLKCIKKWCWSRQYCYPLWAVVPLKCKWGEGVLGWESSPARTRLRMFILSG